MQNKGAIRFFAIALVLVSLFQLSFTFFTKKVERSAKHYANNEIVLTQAKKLAGGNAVLEKLFTDSIRKSRELFFLDSMNNEVVYNFFWVRKYTYKECKEREINLGLDLKGGMDVTLEVSVVDIIKSLSRDPNDPTLNSAIRKAGELQKASESDFITLFQRAFEEIAPDQKLSALFNTIELQEKIKFESTNDEVIAVIRAESEDAIDRTFNILRTRIDRFGVTQPDINRIPGTGRIVVALPGVKDHTRVRKLLQGTAKLEFWETYDFSEVYPYINEANTKLRLMGEGGFKDSVTFNKDSIANTNDTLKTKELVASQDTNSQVVDSNSIEALVGDVNKDSLGNPAQNDEKSFAEFAKENPLYAYLRINTVQDEGGNMYPGRGPVVGYVRAMDTARVNRMLVDAKSVFPRTLKFLWDVKPVEESDQFALIAIKITNRNGKAPLDGDAISNAWQDFGNDGDVEISMSMNSAGAKTWKRLTAENIGKSIAVVLDNMVYTYPTVQDEIPNGVSRITGQFSIDEAKDIANVLKAGKLPAPARIIEEAIVGPSLGKEAINSGFISFVLAFIIVLLYMFVYYNKSGLIADFALVANVFYIFGVLASLGAVLTLPGIAGIVLTLGMAVDANVIIYERIREELRTGKGVRLAIEDGYKNAYSAIIDGNVTTILTGIVLYIFGTGPIQGFATTLIIGILTSLFSSIFISRLIFVRLLDKNRRITFDNSLTRNILTNTKYDFIKARKIAYIASAIVIILGLTSVVFKGLNKGVDFSGGRTYVVRFDQDVETNQVRAALAKQFGESPMVKTFGPNTQVKVTTKYMIDEKSTEVDSLIEIKLYEGVKGFYKTPIDYEMFVSADEDKLVGQMSSQKVDPTISDDLYRSAWLALIFAFLIIFIYIAIRFKKWEFGLGGLVALLHDATIAVSLYSVFSGVLPFTMELDQAFIAAILTIIGYSINDSVIIFDRVREYTHLFPKRLLGENINSAINSTLARTLNTAGTTFVVLLAIFIFGGETIRGFAFVLMIGIVVGTYSSVFTATPIAYDILQWRNKRRERKAALKNKK